MRQVVLDTETTGLAGGAGTVAFLIGVGYFTEEGFRLDQCFMRDYDEEEPMLQFLADLGRLVTVADKPEYKQIAENAFWGRMVAISDAESWKQTMASAGEGRTNIEN